MTKQLAGKNLARLIEETQEANQLSRGEMLRLLDINWSTFVRWKRGIVTPGLNTYFRIIDQCNRLNGTTTQKEERQDVRTV